MSDHPQRREAAVALHRRGAVAEARRAYEALLVERPDDADVRGLLALAIEACGDAAGAEAQLRTALAGPATPDIALRNLNNLVAMLVEAGRRDDAVALVAGELPAWPAARVPDAAERRTLGSLIAALVQLDRAAAALAVVDGVLRHLHGDAALAPALAMLLIEAGRIDEAEALLAAVPAEGAKNGAILALRAAIAHRRGDAAAARAALIRYAALAPIRVEPAKPGQTLTIAVLDAIPLGIEGEAVPIDLHFHGNLPSQLADRHSDRYRFLSIFAEVPGVSERRLPVRPDLVYSNFANPELLSMDGAAAAVAAVADSYGLPILNHPRRVVRGTRQRNAERLAAIPGVIAPPVRRYFARSPDRAAIAADIGATLGYPVILRTVFQHMGVGTTLAADADAAVAAMADFEGSEFYAVRYVDSRHDGLFRQLRLGVAGSARVLLRCEYCDHWNVRARRHQRMRGFYERRPDLLARANGEIREPERVLGPRQLEALDAVVRTVDLDLFGIDFDVTEAGDVLVFEANAAMNLLQTSFGHLGYPPEAEARFLAAVDALFHATARVGRPH